MTTDNNYENDPFVSQLLKDRDALGFLIDNLESFSDIFRRLTDKEMTLTDFANVMDVLAHGAKSIRSKA